MSDWSDDDQWASKMKAKKAAAKKKAVQRVIKFSNKKLCVVQVRISTITHFFTR